MKRDGPEKDFEDITDAMKAQPPKVEYIAEHTMKPDETLSHLALKYYGSAIREKWMVIYEAKKDVIGPNPAHVKPGTVLKIPKLP
jgi:nucleoid-associated protein YgaU